MHKYPRVVHELWVLIFTGKKWLDVCNMKGTQFEKPHLEKIQNSIAVNMVEKNFIYIHLCSDSEYMIFDHIYK